MKFKNPFNFFRRLLSRRKQHQQKNLKQDWKNDYSNEPDIESLLSDSEKKIIDEVSKCNLPIEQKLYLEDKTRNLEKELSRLEPYRLHNRGNDYYRDGNYVEAIKYYYASLKINPNLFDTRFNLALAFTRLGLFHYALEMINSAIDLEPKCPDAHYTKGLILSYIGDYQSAARSYLESYSVDPNYQNAVKGLDSIIYELMSSSQNSYNNFQPNRNKSSSEIYSDPNKIQPEVIDPSLTLEDYADNTEAKRELQDLIEIIKNRNIFSRYNIAPPRGYLLIGPPGSGKTYFGIILASVCQLPFYTINLAEIFSMWLGNSEKNIMAFLDNAASNPFAIIFIDEFDALGASRTDAINECRAERNVRNLLLQVMNGIYSEQYSNLFFLAATNRLDLVDKAFLRPGRFDKIIFIGNPDYEARVEMFKIHTKRLTRNIKESIFSEPIDCKKLAAKSDGLVASEIQYIVKQTLINKILAHIHLQFKVELNTNDFLETLSDYLKNKTN